MSKLLRALLIVYMVSALGYVIYTTITQTGLSGYLMDLQLNYFGVAYMKLAAIAGMMILCLPALLVLRYISDREATFDPQTGQPLRPAPKPTSFTTFLIMGAVPLLASIGVYFYVTKMAEIDQGRQIYKINISEGAEVSPKGDAKFVEVEGLLQNDYQYVIESGSNSLKNSYTYAPLTEADWNPKQPIRYFLSIKDTTTLAAVVNPYRGPAKNKALTTEFSGQIATDSLPTFVRNEFQRQGLVIASPHYVVNLMSPFNGRVPTYGDQMYYLIPIFGALLSLMILIGGGLGLIIRKRRGL